MLLSQPSHPKRLVVHKTVIVVVFNLLRFQQGVCIIDESALDVIPFVLAVEKEAEIVIADVVVVVIDKQVRKHKQQQFVILPKLETLKLLDKEQMLIVIK